MLAPFRDLDGTARSISESDLTQRIEVRGDDELARLARTFNAMLDRLAGAFRSQRQFIDDAGHELRTPITVIRGHLELLGDDPGRTSRSSRAIVLDESDRMSRMVDELLLLARAERPDFLKIDEVDVATDTREVQTKAAALADREWIDGGHADAVINGDRHRITQALMQLAENVVDHSTGDTIEIGSSTQSDAVTLWVADAGPGVPAEQSTPSSSGSPGRRTASRTAEHVGLGLAIVRAIADAHHGGVRSAHRGSAAHASR